LSRVVCPYCYHKINGWRLSYVCTGRGSPGRAGCQPARDPVRENEAGYTGESMYVFHPSPYLPIAPRTGTCDRCGARSAQRACPVCHSPLSADFGRTRSPLIAFLGATGTGKTVFLTVLTLEAATNIRRRFDAAVEIISAAGTMNIEQVLNGGLFQATPRAVDGRVAPVVVEWRHRARGVRRLFGKFTTTYLSFLDTAGEDLQTHDRVRELRYLAAADAYVLLLDPFMIPNARQQIQLPSAAVKATEPTLAVVQRVTRVLREAPDATLADRIGIKFQNEEVIKKPVAVAFAKMDAFFDLLGPDHPIRQAPRPGRYYDEVAGQQTHRFVQSLLHAWGGDEIDGWLRNYYQRFRYFAVSALGRPPDYTRDPTAQPIDPRGIAPFRVDEPLLWLMSEFGLIPKRTRP